MGAGSASQSSRSAPLAEQIQPASGALRGAWRRSLLAGLLSVLLLLPAGCSRPLRSGAGPEPPLAAQKPGGRLQEVAPPPAVQQLQAALASHTPSVAVLSPRDGANLPAGPVMLQLQVRDWPLADAGELGLGAHVAVQVDDQAPLRLTAAGSANNPDLIQVALPPLSPGSHRITAYAARPWGEAVKSPGAWAQVRVNRVAPNPVAVPEPGSPQLIAVSPAELAARQPLLLDWLLLDAPLQGLRDNDGSWRLRVTVNGDSFLLDQNTPLWLQGWQNGSNSLLLELVDGRGAPLNPPFNTLVKEVVVSAAQPAPIWQRGRLSDAELAILLGKAPPPPSSAADQSPTVESTETAVSEPAGGTEPAEETSTPAPPSSEPPSSEPAEPLPSPASNAQDEETVVVPAATALTPATEASIPAPATATPTTPAPPAATPTQPTPQPTAQATTPPAPAAPAAPATPAPRPISSARSTPSTSLSGSARELVNADGSLVKPKPEGPLAGLRQKLGG